MSFSTVIMLGNLTRDPELKYTPKGTAVCEMSVAINRKWKSEGGEVREEVAFIGATAMGRTAENISKFFKKGEKIIIHGYLKQETWEDKATGKKREKTKVFCERFDFCGGSKRETKEEEPGAFVPPPPKATETDDDQDVPF